MEDKRTLMQDSFVNDALKYKRVIAEWGTGVGKSRPAVILIDKILSQKPDSQILLLVGEREHKENWRKEFVKFLGEEMAWEVYNNIRIECYASLHKLANTEWTLVCADEGHHLFSDLRIAILRTIKTEYFIMLSATLKREYVAEIDHLFGKFHHSRISLQKSIDNGFIPEPQIILHPLTLDTRVYTQEITLTKGVKAKRKTLRCRYEERWEYMRGDKYPNLELIVRCTEQQKYAWLEEQFEYYKSRYFQNPGNDFMKNQWLRIGAQRKTYLGTLKTKYVKSLIDGFKKEDRRFICFCTNIEQANALGGKNAVTSKNKNASKIVQEFNDGKTDSLFAVSMLTEGMNLTNLDCGIVVQLDGSDRLWLQKSGRMYRSEKPEQHIFYYPNTRDEQFLKKALEKINKDYVKTV